MYCLNNFWSSLIFLNNNVIYQISKLLCLSGDRVIVSSLIFVSVADAWLLIEGLFFYWLAKVARALFCDKNKIYFLQLQLPEHLVPGSFVQSWYGVINSVTIIEILKALEIKDYCWKGCYQELIFFFYLSS